MDTPLMGLKLLLGPKGYFLSYKLLAIIWLTAEVRLPNLYSVNLLITPTEVQQREECNCPTIPSGEL